jgi:hypothetical protein
MQNDQISIGWILFFWEVKNGLAEKRRIETQKATKKSDPTIPDTSKA